LLQTYDGTQPVAGWVMSEKLDGVRALWDGERLRSRGGATLHAPAWFTRGLPRFALDGELWTRRGDFESIVSIVRRHQPDARWSQVGYHIFEVPHQAGGLLQRLAVLEDYLRAHPSPPPHLYVIAQTPIESPAHLRAYLAEVNAGGGEGAVARNPDAPYRSGRLADALKVKTHDDAECVVREILPGKGKYTGQMGALRCELIDDKKINNTKINDKKIDDDKINNDKINDKMIADKITNDKIPGGAMVRIGTGFSDRLRARPPAIGSVITFKHYGVTRNGKPRFPVYLRTRR
ncbi:MAG: DNA ligase, partial [bacterium]